MACLAKSIGKKHFTFILATIIICQLVLFSSFLSGSVIVMAQEEDNNVTTPAENTAVGDPAPPAVDNLPPSDTAAGSTPETITEASKTATADTASTTEINLTESSSSTERVGEISATTSETSMVNQATGATATLNLGTGSGNSVSGNSPDNSGISQTGLIADMSGGSGPTILAQWEMNGATSTDEQYAGNDDASDSGAQFLPSGQYQSLKTIIVCAIATDPDGLADVNSVGARVYYPENIALAANRQAGGGCGKIYGEQFELAPLSSEEGVELFCDKIKNSNNNLPIFNTGENFDSICAPIGGLESSTARVYCAAKNLSYDDPAGNYKVEVTAQDKINNLSPIATDVFKYLELTAFAVDFDAVSYGPVKLNTPKIIEGNLGWEAPISSNPATIRNVGNTRLQLTVKQNDFGLGKTNNVWNVGYQARIGTSSAFVFYPPEQAKAIGQIIDLAEINALEFGIEVYNFPVESTSAYAGQMTLTADRAEYLTCI